MFRSNSNRELNHDPELMHNRLQYTEKFLQKVSSNLEKIVQKEASLRDHHDQLVEDIIEFTNFERINLTMRVNLEEFAKQLSTIQDYRDALIKRIQHQVLQPLDEYHEIIKQKKELLNKNQLKTKKGIEERQKLERQRNRSPASHQGISSAAQSSAHLAQNESQHSQRILHEEMLRFEQEKLIDMKKFFTDYSLIHLAFHSRALEYMTNAHQKLSKINVDQDLQEFRRFYLEPASASKPAENSKPPLVNHSNPNRSNSSSLQDDYANSPSQKKGQQQRNDPSADEYVEINERDEKVPPRPTVPPSLGPKSQSLSTLNDDSSNSSVYAKPMKPFRNESNPKSVILPSPSPSLSSSSSTTTTESSSSEESDDE